MNLAPWQRAQIEREIQFSAVRSRGPGGQNVNKVSSAAVLQWSPASSAALLPEQRQRLFYKLEKQLTADGLLLIRSDEFRDLPQNKSRALEKLFEILEKALHKPKKRIATRPTRASRERKLEGKSIKGRLKHGRRKVHPADYED